MSPSMNEKGFSVSQAVRFGWKTAKSHLGFLIPFYLAGYIVIAAPAVAAFSLKGKILSQGLLFLAIIPLSIIVFMGFIKTSLKFSNGETGTFSDLFSSAHLFFKFLGASILNTLVVGALPGLLFAALLSFFPTLFKSSPMDVARGFGLTLFFPILVAFTSFWVVIWSIRLSLFPHFVVDKGFGPVASLKASFRATKGVFWDEMGLGLALGVINYLGILCFAVGYFIFTLPLSFLAIAHVYQKLGGEKT